MIMSPAKAGLIISLDLLTTSLRCGYWSVSGFAGWSPISSNSVRTQPDRYRKRF
jgi:hypothetical protein